MDEVFTSALELAIERHLPAIAQTVKSEYMSMRSVATMLDVSLKQAGELMREWKIERIRYQDNGFHYVRRADVEAAIERLKDGE